jgi:hypothetical protein
MTNCSMMNIPPSEARAFSLEEYEARLFHWNKAHDTGTNDDAPDGEEAMRVLAAANSDERLIH